MLGRSSSSIRMEEALRDDAPRAYEMNSVTLPEGQRIPFETRVPGELGHKWLKWPVKIVFMDNEYKGCQQSRGYSYETHRVPKSQ